ncbi:hypothetical protein H0H87_006564 [Tephrocybe sp. NHM501043]|nr:hypothetical protein H0H87_006564 [Tephrocybe sp. NHM501043]
MDASPLWEQTPLLYSPKISETLGVDAYLKLENLHPSHSFKYRGLSLFAQRAIQTHGPNTHLIVASGGNAGLATACAAHALNLKCTVYLPTGAAQSTIESNRRLLQSRLERRYASHHLTKTSGSNPPPVPLIALETIGSDCFYHSLSLNAPRFNSTSTTPTLPPNVTPTTSTTENGETVSLAHFHQFSSKASGSLGASQPSARVVQVSLTRPGKIVSASVPDELSMQALTLFADDHKLLVELACSTTLTPAYKPAFFDKLVPLKSPEAKRTVVFIVCGGFKVSLSEAFEYASLVAADKALGGTWSVLMDDGSRFEVEK